MKIRLRLRCRCRCVLFSAPCDSTVGPVRIPYSLHVISDSSVVVFHMHYSIVQLIISLLLSPHTFVFVHLRSTYHVPCLMSHDS